MCQPGGLCILTILILLPELSLINPRRNLGDMRVLASSCASELACELHWYVFVFLPAKH